MADLKTTYLGLELKNPIIAGSSGLTSTVEGVKELEKSGVSAVVLKSLFEEQIIREIENTTNRNDLGTFYSEAYDYMNAYGKEYNVNKYLELIKESKEAVEIPVIASINCISSSEWIEYAERIEKAGADALELNIFIMPSDVKKDSKEMEAEYLDIINKVKKLVKIPLAVKVSYHFTAVANMLKRIALAGVDSLVLFNRFFSPDIDIEKEDIISSNIYSEPNEITVPLRWVGMMSNDVKCDIAATTGIHDGESVVKAILAGADAVQVVSAVYLNGPEIIGRMLKEVKVWMAEKEYKDIKSFKGKLARKSNDDIAVYERVQFMKYFANIK